MKTYDAYLFDMDGTVSQTVQPWLQIMQETFDRYDIRPGDARTTVRKVFGNARAGLIELGVPAEDLHDIFEEWTTKSMEAMLKAKLYPGIKDILTSLKRDGKKLALLTSSGRRTIEVILKVHDLENVFDVIICGDEVKAHKPNPSSLLAAMEQMGADVHATVMLGDSEKDIRAAHNAGVDSVLFYPPEHEIFHDLAELQADKPTYVIHAWRELATVTQRTA